MKSICFFSLSLALALVMLSSCSPVAESSEVRLVDTQVAYKERVTP